MFEPSLILLDLPVFSAPGRGKLYSRLTKIIANGVVQHVFYPIFPPNTHGLQVLDGVAANPC